MSQLAFDISVAEACTEVWGHMAGSDSKRYCAACERSVHNLEMLTARQIGALLVETDGQLCGRIRTLPHQSIAYRSSSPTRGSFAFVALAALGGLTRAAASQAPQVAVDRTQSDQAALQTTVAGSITDQAGVLIVGAHVIALLGSDEIASTMTDANGTYRLTLPAGAYVLNVMAEGFLTSEAIVEFDSASSVPPQAKGIVQDVALMPHLSESITVTADAADSTNTTQGVLVSSIYYGRWYKRVGFRIKHPVAYARSLFRQR